MAKAMRILKKLFLLAIPLIFSGCIFASTAARIAPGNLQPEDEFEKEIIRQAEEQKEAQLKDYFAQYYYKEGKVHFKKGAYQEALNKFKRALYWKPDFLSAVTYIKLIGNKFGRQVIADTANKPAIAVYPQAAAYHIGLEDTLEILVGGYPELSRELTVRQDGTIFYPAIGNLRAAGLTLNEFEQVIIKGLNSQIKGATVAVTVKSFGAVK